MCNAVGFIASNNKSKVFHRVKHHDINFSYKIIQSCTCNYASIKVKFNALTSMSCLTLKHCYFLLRTP